MNVRALRLLMSEILRGHINDIFCFKDLISYLENASSKSITSKHWVENLIKPVLMVMQFIRAEREGEWALHLHACKEMIPYFFAANHTNYARYGLYYLRRMERLPPDILKHFLKGEHVMRHQDGIWNGIWVDMLIETTFMRYGKGPGGLIGVTLNPETVKKWALSLHTCNNVLRDFDTIRNQKDIVKTYHKEELKSRIAADEVDRIKLRNMLNTCVHPLAYADHNPEELINIFSGQISSDKVNVPRAIEIGRNEMITFDESWPDGFRETISKKVVTMNDSKKHVKVGEI